NTNLCVLARCHFEFDRRESIEKAGELVLDMLVPRYSN
ncbi:MAG: hypothetical protein JWO44_1687, partial [Bacteroidetes bacterium]|nr:hypothetical protein [Bacteroidota bacterium]